MARYRPEHRNKTHTAIREAAAERLRAQGFEGMSVGTVMKAAGLTHGGFYAHFADKTDLLAAAMEQALIPTVDRFERWTAAALAAEDPAKVAEAYLSEYHVAHPGEGCAAAALASEIGRQAPPVREAFARGAESAAAILGRLYPGPAAWGAFAMMFGALALMRAAPEAAMRAEIRERVLQDLRKLAESARTGPSEGEV